MIVYGIAPQQFMRSEPGLSRRNKDAAAPQESDRFLLTFDNSLEDAG